MRLPALLLLLTCAPAHAGGWLQEQGHGFAAAGVSLNGNAPRLHLEYGLSETLTLGLTGWGGPDGTSGETLAFARRKIPVPLLDQWHFAAEIGAGAHRSSQGKEDAIFSLALGAGRGLPWGWLDLSAQITFASTNPVDWRGTDQISLGYDVTDSFAVMGQWRAETLGLEGTTTSGALFAIWRAHPSLRVVAEAEQDFSTDGPDFRVSLWSEF